MAYTTNIDGMDLELLPNTFRADPIERTAKASGIMGNVHFRWPNSRRVKLLTLIYQDLSSEQAQILVGAFGPRTLHNKVLSVELNLDRQMFFIPGGVNLRASSQNGRWHVEIETHAIEYDELGGQPMNTVLATLSDPALQFAVYRYGHLYCVQTGQVTVLDPQGEVSVVALGYTPNTWANFGGRMALYHPTAGASALIGKELTYTTSAAGTYTAPLGAIHNAGVPVEVDYEAMPGAELNGVPYTELGGVYAVDAFRTSFYVQPQSALFDARDQMAFFNTSENFAFYNGSYGQLLYATLPPTPVVPYAYPLNGILAGGFDGGYVFSPDMGISWRRRNLSGFGVMTERGVLSVSNTHGIRVETGVW